MLQMYYLQSDETVDIVKGFKTIYGDGRASSFGPQLLDVNSSYILHGKKR